MSPNFCSPVVITINKNLRRTQGVGILGKNVEFSINNGFIYFFFQNSEIGFYKLSLVETVPCSWYVMNPRILHRHWKCYPGNAFSWRLFSLLVLIIHLLYWANHCCKNGKYLWTMVTPSTKNVFFFSAVLAFSVAMKYNH
ncbi:Uncharacterized protein APZ42_014204 [Daphnia magna]|uniref:Uncharacterized protein n=1 Tax=Daphnia magna TaxID=35525 RepID=A0A162Q2F9_9CRUS|nr:Uncharacterized protein APZ42_014204 [Daphnia magna]